jgi:alpha-beta hydrolase superfamily lysophospholipase
MQTRESTLSGGRGVTLHTVVWEPDDPSTVVADVVLVHGYGEHSRRYVPVAEVLTAAGFRVSALDLRGHGRTVGLRRGDIDDFDTLVDDVSAYVDTVRTDLPLFAYGHSMGGLAVVRLAERDDSRFAGLVITSPALAAAESIPAPLVAVANVVGKLAPGLRTIALEGDAISRDQAVRDDYDRDPYNFRGKLTAGTGRQMNIAIGAALADAARISCPVLVLHGTADRLTAPVGSERFVAAVSSTDRTLRTWPGAYHELHHEPEREEVLATITGWITDHLSAVGGSTPSK